MTTRMAERVAQFLAGQWRDAGLKPGETLLLHSSLRRTTRAVVRAGAQVGDAAEIVLDSFLEALGPDGTLLLPLFNFDFTSGATFDIRNTPSQMGALTEAGRRRPGAVRTGHPIYSFAVIGRRAEAFRDVANLSGYGADSPFAMLREMGGRIGVLDLPDQHSMTFYHHVEEMKAAPWRFQKTFEGDWIGWDGAATTRTFGLFVRDLERGVVTDVDAMGELLWARGLYQGDRPGEGSGLRLIDSGALFDATAEVIDQGKAEGLLYRIETPAAA
jgi:aminoglycoside 3-N-acetyltransferase